MARVKIPARATPEQFAKAWATELRKAVLKVAGKDGVLTERQAGKLELRANVLERFFHDNAHTYFDRKRIREVGVEDFLAAAERYALTAAKKMLKARGASAVDMRSAEWLPQDLQGDYFEIRKLRQYIRMFPERKPSLNAAAAERAIKPIDGPVRGLSKKVTLGSIPIAARKSLVRLGAEVEREAQTSEYDEQVKAHYEVYYSRNDRSVIGYALFTQGWDETKDHEKSTVIFVDAKGKQFHRVEDES
jgi:hypothetical protein